MRRSLVTSTCALVLALVPATLRAQQPPAQTPPAQPPAAQQPPAQAQPEQNAAPKMGLTTSAGLFLVQIKPDQTAAFEEMVTTLKGALAKSSNPTHQKQATGIRFYKATEPMGANALYVVVVDPSVPNAEYSFLNLLANTLTAEQQRAPETVAMFKKFADAFGGGINKLNLTPIGGGM
jgi:hypothetical protein